MVFRGFRPVSYTHLKYQVEMPIVQTVNAVVNKGMSAAEAVRSLMDRDPKNELPQSYEK